MNIQVYDKKKMEDWDEIIRRIHPDLEVKKITGRAVKYWTVDSALGKDSFRYLLSEKGRSIGLVEERAEGSVSYLNLIGCYGSDHNTRLNLFDRIMGLSHGNLAVQVQPHDEPFFLNNGHMVSVKERYGMEEVRESSRVTLLSSSITSNDKLCHKRIFDAYSPIERIINNAHMSRIEFYQ